MLVKRKRIDGLSLNPITLGPPVDLKPISRQGSHMKCVVIASGIVLKLRGYHY